MMVVGDNHGFSDGFDCPLNATNEQYMVCNSILETSLINVN